MIRPLIALVLVAGLTACGFHLRSRLALPPDTPAVKVTSSSPYSELVKLLKRGVQASGATVADDEAESDFAQLNVLSERWGNLAIAIDAEGRAQEYSLRYAVIFKMVAADGSVLVPQQVIEMSRDYVAPATDSTGTDSERDILARELRKDMASSILRRIDSVVRARLEKGTPLETGDAQPATTEPAATEPATTEPATTEPAATTPADSTTPATTTEPVLPPSGQH